MVGVAQLVERRVVAPAVAGSSPVSHPTAGVAELADALDLGSSALVACGFDSHLPHHAGVAQLVEHNLAKVGVAGSSPVARSIKAA
jgi:hypothetical protein